MAKKDTSQTLYKEPKDSAAREIQRILLVTAASVIFALNLNSFVHAGNTIPGGFTGLTLLLQRIASEFLGVALPYSAVNFLLNAVPAIIAFKTIGKRFTLYSCLGIFLTGIFTDILPATPLTNDILLISVFGGLINGAAISLALIGGSSTGGTDFIAVYFAEKRNKDVWNYILMGNGVVLVMAGILFGWDKALYSIIFQFTSTQTIHLLYQAYNKVTLFIVTDNPKAVYEAIYQVTNHSATEFSATGMYSNEGRKMIYSVVSSTEAKVLIRKVMKADPHAFVNVVKTDILMGRFYQKENY